MKHFDIQSNTRLKTQISLLFFKISGAFLSLLVLILSTQEMEKSQTELILLILSALVASNFLDFGILTQISSRFQAQYSSSHSALDQAIGLNGLVRDYFRKFLMVSVTSSLIICSLVLSTNSELSKSHLLANTIFLFSLFLIYAITNYINRTFVALGKIQLLLVLQFIGAALNLITIVAIMSSGKNFYLIVSSFLVPNIFISVCVFVTRRNVTKGNSKRLEEFSWKKVDESYQKIGFVLQSTQLMQFSINLLVPFIVAEMFSHETFVQFVFCSRIFGLLTSTFGALVFAQLREDTNSMFSSKKFDKIMLISRTDYQVLVVTSSLSVIISLVLYFSWSLLNTNVSAPTFIDLICWTLSVVIQVLNSRIYFKFIALSFFQTNLVLTSVQLLSIGITTLFLRFNDLSVVLTILIPNISVLASYFIFLHFQKARDLKE